MDVLGGKVAQKKSSTLENRCPLAPSQKKDGVIWKPRTKEILSPYKTSSISSSVSSTTAPRRCPSPNKERASQTLHQSSSKRAQSTDRKRPSASSSPRRSSTPSSPIRPSTPVSGLCMDVQVSSKNSIGSRAPEHLWPSSRRMSVSFQTNKFSVPISKREISSSRSLSDPILSPPTNLVYKQTDNMTVWKMTPERKRTIQGKGNSDLFENSKPLDTLNSRMLDQILSSSRNLTRSLDLTDKFNRIPPLPSSERGFSPVRRNISESTNRNLKSINGVSRKLSFDGCGRSDNEIDTSVVASVQASRPKKVSSSASFASSSFERSMISTRSARSQSPSCGTRSPSPTKASSLPSQCRGNPSLTRSRLLTSFTSPNATTSFPSTLKHASDAHNGKKGGNYIEDSHNLRLLYNRYMQWRFVNAHADVTNSTQQEISENILYAVWSNILELHNSNTIKRIKIQELKLEIKIDSVLKNQITYLVDWGMLERDHCNSLSGAMEALKSCILQIPVVEGARVDNEKLQWVIGKSIHVLQLVCSSIHSLMSKVENINCLASEFADIVAEEKALLDECGELLSLLATLQIKEASLRGYLLQLYQDTMKREATNSSYLNRVKSSSNKLYAANQFRGFSHLYRPISYYITPTH